MKPDEPLGLVGAGGVNRSFLSRMPALLARLGPVKATSFRVARRVANGFKAGYAVPHYAALEPCPAIFVAVPEAGLDRVLADLAAQIPLRQNVVVLCGCVRDSLSAGPLSAAGARVASLNAIPEARERTFVAEGHPGALRLLRSLLAKEKRTIVEIRAGAKPLYWAGAHMTTQLLLPWVSASVRSLCAAGFPRAEATHVAHQLGAGTLRSWARIGRKSWRGMADPSLRLTVERDSGRLTAADPRLTELYTDAVRLAIAYFEDPPK